MNSLIDTPRDKLDEFGPTYLSTAELLAILFHTGYTGCSAQALAQQLMSHYGSLRNLLAQPKQVLCQHPGIGPNKYATLQAAHELGIRLLTETIAEHPIHSVLDLKDYLVAKLSHLQSEVFACLYLSNSNHVRHFRILFQGTINKTMIYAREVVKDALLHNACKLILVHNHPCGSLQISYKDKQLTKRLSELLQQLDIIVIDHLIVARSQIISIYQDKTYR